MKIKFRINPVFSELIPAALSACDGILFDNCSSCPHCGGIVVGYDVKTKHFADIIDGSAIKTVKVRIKRFRCSKCSTIVYADQPFYPKTRAGSPIVDLCVVLSTIMPYSRAATSLQEFGVNVDRWSVRNYAIQIPRCIPLTELYGIMLPESIISLAALTYNNGIGTSFGASEIISSCGYPSSQKSGAALEKLSDKKEIDYTRFFPSLCCD